MIKLALTRRDFVKASALTVALTSMNQQVYGAKQKQKKLNKLNKIGKIGTLEISRLILGGNFIAEDYHTLDIAYARSLAIRYNTRERLLRTLANAEVAGINTVIIHCGEWMNILKEHRKSGGKMQWIMCNTDKSYSNKNSFDKDSINKNIDLGANAIYTWEGEADNAKIDAIAGAVEFAKKQGVPSGVGTHNLETIEKCNKSNIDTDFYIKTLSHPDKKSDYCQNPEKVIELMRNIKKPWIGFETMASGCIPATKAFKYCFENGTDFISAPMFDFDIINYIKIIKGLLARDIKRERPWNG